MYDYNSSCFADAFGLVIALSTTRVNLYFVEDEACDTTLLHLLIKHEMCCWHIDMQTTGYLSDSRFVQMRGFIAVKRGSSSTSRKM